MISPPQIDESLIPELYKLSQLMQKPMQTVVNLILRESIPFYKLQLNKVGLVFYPISSVENALTLKRIEKRFSHLYVCPLCERNFDVRNGNVLTVELKNKRKLKFIVCSRCYQSEDQCQTRSDQTGE